MERDSYIQSLECRIAELENERKFRVCDEIGKEFQDLLTDNLLRVGINLNCYSSRKYQLNCGEGASLIECKHDSKWRETNRLYIEVNAINKNQDKMIDGGIAKKDHSWLYVIGDHTHAWLFSKKQLNRLYEKLQEKPKLWEEKYGIKIYSHIDKDTQKITSNGMCLPIDSVYKIGLCLMELDLKGMKKNERI